MSKIREELKELLREFIELAERDDIWYSMDKDSLLGVVRHGGFVPWSEKITIMMSMESLNKLRRLHRERVVSSHDDSKIKNLSAYFVKDKSDIVSQQPFLQIRTLVPTTTKKLRKTLSKWNYLSQKIKGNRVTDRSIINSLYANKHEGYLLLESTKYHANKRWVQALSFRTVNKKFNGIEVKVIEEYDLILSYWYGIDYMDAKVPDHEVHYISPVVSTKEKF